MSDPRPDPDALLARVQAEEAKQARGRLKVFFGAAPGVGKTYAMLEAARNAAKEGADVVVGYVEPHSRPETQALVLGLDVLPRLEVPYRGTRLLEFHLDAALERHPQLILVDELAHTNAPGMTHTKRWQDVVRLLDAGIDVYTTLNVQHLESLRDVVTQITGSSVREAVPDAIFDEADEIELVDLAPEDLLQRLREGKVYVPREAERAVEHFFSQGNLIALRELALRRSAERVGQQMDDFRQRVAARRTWPARERLLVCVGPSPFSARLIRATRRMAAGLKAPWLAVHVETPEDARLDEAERGRLAANLHLAEQLGGEAVTISGPSVADELISYAQSRNVTKIVVGKPLTPRWREWIRGSLVYELARKCGDIDVYVISGEAGPRGAPPPAGLAPPWRRKDYLAAAAVVVFCTLLSAVLFRYLNITAVNLVMVYLLGVVAVSLRFGRGPSVLAAVASVALFDFCFIEPYFTFAVHDTQYVLTFAVLLATGLVIATLTGQVRFQVEAARRREGRTAALYALGRELAATRDQDQVVRAALPQVASAAQCRVCALLPDATRQLAVHTADGKGAFRPSPHDETVARWVFDHREPAGRGTLTLPGAEGLYLPLIGSVGPVGVLGVWFEQEDAFRDPERRHLLEAFAGLIALAIERVELAEEAQRIGLEAEAERLRSSLLSAVSHDLRTPLAAILGASSALLEAGPALDDPTRRELLGSIASEAERLHRLVTNLLDMTRLEAHAITPNKQWQPVEEIIGAAVRRMSGRLAGHPVHTDLAPDLPLAPLDELLIEQVLVNLLDNACKFAPPGTPIEIRARAGPGQVSVEVGNAGPGLPPEDLTRVFDKFYRSPGASGGAGTGLGLAICRGIVHLHGGAIRAENRPGGGVTFSFTLPVEGGPPSPPPESLGEQPDSARHPGVHA